LVRPGYPTLGKHGNAKDGVRSLYFVYTFAFTCLIGNCAVVSVIIRSSRLSCSIIVEYRNRCNPFQFIRRKNLEVTHKYVVPTDEEGKVDPEVKRAWVEATVKGLDGSPLLFDKILKEFTTPFNLSVGMNVAVFVLGAVVFSVMTAYSLTKNQPYLSAVFGGMDMITVLTFFLRDPIKRLEHDVGFITWVGLVYNSYWIGVTSATNPETFQKDLKEITDNATDSLGKLLDKEKEFDSSDLMTQSDAGSHADGNSTKKK